MLTRRRSLQLAAGAFTFPMMSQTGWAQAYPSRPVRLIEPFGAGGAPDIVARLIAQRLQERLSQPFIVENRSGANGNIATEAVARSQPDGYTLLVIGVFNTINATLYDKLPFNFDRDIAPVAGIIRFPFVMVVHPSVPAGTVQEFIAYARSNPGKLNMASPGSGSGIHVAGELFKMRTGVDIVHVPFRGPQAITGMIGGQAHVFFGVAQSVLEHVRAGKLRALAVTGSSRWLELPDVPTVAETIPAFEASGWFGIGAPKGTPSDIIRRLNAEINTGLNEPRIKRTLETGGATLVVSPDELGQLISDEIKKWAEVIKFAGLKAQ